MSFLNFGTSPTKSSSGHAHQLSNSQFDAFGPASSCDLFGGSGVSRASLFDSTGFVTPMKQEHGCGQGDDITPPVKKQKPGTPYLETNPTSMPSVGSIKEPNKSPVESKLMRVAPSIPGLSTVQGFPQFEEAKKSRDVEPDVTPAQNMSKSNSALSQDVNVSKTGTMPADELFKDLLSMQTQQLSELLPELKASEEKSEHVVNNAMLIFEEVNNYSEKLVGIKQQYISRLNHVSSFLKMMPQPKK